MSRGRAATSSWASRRSPSTAATAATTSTASRTPSRSAPSSPRRARSRSTSSTSATSTTCRTRATTGSAPRSCGRAIWDHGKELVKDYSELLKMPDFGMSEREAQAVHHQPPGLHQGVGASPTRQGRQPTAGRARSAAGRKLITRFNCQGCHLIEGEGHAIQHRRSRTPACCRRTWRPRGRGCRATGCSSSSTIPSQRAAAAVADGAHADLRLHRRPGQHAGLATSRPATRRRRSARRRRRAARRGTSAVGGEVFAHAPVRQVPSGGRRGGAGAGGVGGRPGAVAAPRPRAVCATTGCPTGSRTRRTGSRAPACRPTFPKTAEGQVSGPPLGPGARHAALRGAARRAAAACSPARRR